MTATGDRIMAKAQRRTERASRLSRLERLYEERAGHIRATADLRGRLMMLGAGDDLAAWRREVDVAVAHLVSLNETISTLESQG